jgi:hypothetical protein
MYAIKKEMKNKVLLLCMILISCLMCMSASTPTDNIESATYATDGLLEQTNNDTELICEYEKKYDQYVSVENNQFVVDYESLSTVSDFDDNFLENIKSNIEFANTIAKEMPNIVKIVEDKSVSFNIDDEYAEQWDAWQLSWNFWKGWTYKLDSDFGKLVGITGLVYRMISYISNGTFFFKNITSITDQSKLAATFSTIFFYLPGKGVQDFIVTYLQNFAGSIASGLVTINLMLMTLKHASLGTGWLIFKIVDFILGRVTPSLITSASMIYNCFKYNAPIYCKISPWTFSITYSLNKF